MEVTHLKIYKKIAGMLLALAVAALLLPAEAFAAGSIDLSRACKLSISYEDNGVPLAGAAFSIYLVATVDEYGELTATEEFDEFNVNIRGKNDDAWKALASTLEGYALRDGLVPAASGTTDSSGRVSFPSGEQALTPGLYLVLGARHRQNGWIYDAQPAMVLLPALDMEANDWLYDVAVSPKHDSRPEPVDDTLTRKVLKVWKDEGHEAERPRTVTVQLLRDGVVYDTATLSARNNWRYTWEDLDAAYRWIVVEEAPGGYAVTITREGVTFVVTNTWGGPGIPVNPTPGPDGLPQTGQTWWPVPLLIAAGLLLVVMGLLRRRGTADEKE